MNYNNLMSFGIDKLSSDCMSLETHLEATKSKVQDMIAVAKHKDQQLQEKDAKIAALAKEVKDLQADQEMTVKEAKASALQSILQVRIKMAAEAAAVGILPLSWVPEARRAKFVEMGGVLVESTSMAMAAATGVEKVDEEKVDAEKVEVTPVGDEGIDAYA